MIPSPTQLVQLAEWIQGRNLAASTPDQIVAAYVPTVSYQTYYLTARGIYDQTGALYNDPSFARGAAILNGFQQMANAAGRPASDFYNDLTTPGSPGLNIGTPQAQAFLASLVDPNGTYTPGSPAVIAAGKLLTPQEAQVLGSLGSTSTPPIPGLASIATADAQAALNVIAGWAVVQQIQNGAAGALGQVNQAINAGTTLPTPQQVIAAYVAAAYPGYTVAVTAPQGG